MLAGNQPSPEQVNDLNAIGFYYLCSSQLDPAEEYAQRGLAMIEQVPADERINYPNLWLNLSHVARQQQNFGLAKDRLLAAWKVLVRYVTGNGLLDLTLLHNHAWLMIQSGNWREADRISRIALRAYDLPDLPARFFISFSCVFAARSLIHEHQQECDLALTDIRRALDLLNRASPWNPAARRHEIRKCEEILERLRSLPDTPTRVR